MGLDRYANMVLTLLVSGMLCLIHIGIIWDTGRTLTWAPCCRRGVWIQSADERTRRPHRRSEIDYGRDLGAVMNLRYPRMDTVTDMAAASRSARLV